MAPSHSHKPMLRGAVHCYLSGDGSELLCRRRDDDRSPERGRPSRTEHVSALLPGMGAAHALHAQYIRGRRYGILQTQQAKRCLTTDSLTA